MIPTRHPAEVSGRATTRWVIVLILFSTASVPCPADELILKDAVVEGQVLGEAYGVIRLRTVSGELAVPQQAIVRRVPGPSRLEAYHQLKSQTPPTADGHLRMAEWCRSARLFRLADQHLTEALKLDPLHEEALRMAGYVPLGDVWLSVGPPPPPPPPRRHQPEVVLANLRTGWMRKFGAIRDPLSGRTADPDGFVRGRAQVLSYRDPLIVEPACAMLGGDSAVARVLLCEILGQYPEDAASLNLIMLALFDPDVPVREAAAVQLGRRVDPRCSRDIRAALATDHEELVRRAAQALGWMRDHTAIDELIGSLRADVRRGPATPTRLWLPRITGNFTTPTPVYIEEQPFEVPPAVFLPDFNRKFHEFTGRSPPARGPFRNEVQDALILITGVNFGYDEQAWRDWLAQQNPSLVP